jgi:heme exporter protein C
MRLTWWKILSIFLLLYAVAGGLLLPVPELSQLGETIRNLYYHVCMWFAMMILFTISIVHSVNYLNNKKYIHDIKAKSYAGMGVFMGLLGYSTGAIWASYTWADPNNPAYASFGSIMREPKLIGAALALLVYGAYFILRNSIIDIDQRARVSAVYNIFAYAMLFPTIWIIPRLLPSLHPGKEGNPALNFNDIDARMRVVFYPAVIGWTLLGVWITHLKIRLQVLNEKKISNEQ